MDVALQARSRHSVCFARNAVLPPLEAGFQEVTTVSGTGSDRIELSLSNEWQVAYYATAAEPGKMARFSLDIEDQPGSPAASSAEPRRKVNLSNEFTHPAMNGNTNWNAIPGKVILIVSAPENISEWAIRVEERTGP